MITSTRSCVVAVLLAGAAAALVAGPAAADDAALVSDPSVVLASGVTGSPDALAAGPLASALSDGLLLTDPAHLSASAKTYIHDNAPTTVVIVGGAGAVSSTVETEIGAASPGVTIRRVYGHDRYETAKAATDLVDWLFAQYSAGSASPSPTPSATR